MLRPLAAVALGLALASSSAAIAAPLTLTAPAFTMPILRLLPQSVGPDACDKPKGVLIKKTGGTFTIPGCKGWSGTFGYPPQAPVHWPSFHFQLTSSVTNNFGAPPPPSGTAIFYLQMGFLGHIPPDFQNTGVTDTISSPQLKPSQSYSVYVYEFDNGPYWAGIGSPVPSTDSITFVSPLNGEMFSGPIVWQFVQN